MNLKDIMRARALQDGSTRRGWGAAQRARTFELDGGGARLRPVTSGGGRALGGCGRSREAGAGRCARPRAERRGTRSGAERGRRRWRRGPRDPEQQLEPEREQNSGSGFPLKTTCQDEWKKKLIVKIQFIITGRNKAIRGYRQEGRREVNFQPKDQSFNRIPSQRRDYKQIEQGHSFLSNLPPIHHTRRLRSEKGMFTVVICLHLDGRISSHMN
ncbi:uncharacterized protein ACOB7L_022566 [Callospermophilus lateralis]|uniref:uncharacterized protein LOC143397864 n=1 Tax=Callospermophilus lateralis TaxID=76772 RepID=UPI00403859AF